MFSIYFFDVHDTALFAICVNQQHFGIGDSFINTWSVILGWHLPVHRSANGIISLELLRLGCFNSRTRVQTVKKVPKDLLSDFASNVERLKRFDLVVHHLMGQIRPPDQLRSTVE